MSEIVKKIKLKREPNLQQNNKFSIIPCQPVLSDACDYSARILKGLPW